jgi:hypothetical protein
MAQIKMARIKIGANKNWREIGSNIKHDDDDD